MQYYSDWLHFIQEELVDNLAGLLVVMRRPDAGENKMSLGIL